MRLLSVVLVMIATLSLLTYTNPGMDDYREFIFFSLYEAEFGNERLKAIGLLKRFVVLETPKAP